MKILVVVILGNTDRSRVVIITSPWISRWNFADWTRWESHLQSHKIICEYQERNWLPIWVSRPKKGQISTKRKGMPSEMSVWRTFKILSWILRNCLIKLMIGGGPNMIPLTFTLPNKTACKVYDDSWCPQLARLPYKNGNDWDKTHPNLARLF